MCGDVWTCGHTVGDEKKESHIIEISKKFQTKREFTSDSLVTVCTRACTHHVVCDVHAREYTANHTLKDVTYVYG